MGFRRVGWLGFAFMAFTSPVLAAAQNGAVHPPEPDMTEIEVLSQREMARRVFKDNLEELTAPLSVIDAIPRFYQPLCVTVAGIAPDEAKFVADRITRISIDAGLGAPMPNCRTNALVMVVHNPEKAYEWILDKRLDLFGVLPFRDVHARRIRDDVRSRKPVVWWNVLDNASSEGGTINELGLVVSQTVAATRTVNALYRPKALAVVMYDADRLRSATLGQVADHAALYILGTPRRGIEFGNVDLPSMLSLFEDGPEVAPATLTDFDTAYLKGLYSLSPGAFQSRVPRAVVASYAAQCEAQKDDCRIRLRN